MAIRPFQFLGDYAKERSIQVDNQQLINMYLLTDPYNPEQVFATDLPGLSDGQTFDPRR